MRFSVLKAGTPDPIDHQRSYDFAEMFIELLAEPGETWVVHDAEKDKLPEEPTEFNGFLITGSPHSVNDPFPWIERLREYVCRLYRHRVPLVGICFGHQLIADALGGKVERNSLGWEVGTQEIRLTPEGVTLAAPQAGRKTLKILQIHQDVVTRLPPDAVHLASGRRTRHEMYAVGGSVLGIQGHPEFDAEFVREVINSLSKEGELSPLQARHALDSLAQEPDRDCLRNLLTGFLKRQVST